MGCFLGCFGGSKDNKKRLQNSHITHFPQPNPNIGKQSNQIQQTVVVAKQEYFEEPIKPIILESRVKPEEEKLSLTNQSAQEEQLSLGARKRVTFDSNVKEYEHVSCSKAPEILEENETLVEYTKPSKSPYTRVTFDSNVKEYDHVLCDETPEILEENETRVESTNPSKSSSTSESGSTLSSERSFPPNHRYQNCRYSDDEDDDLDCVVSDLDEDDDDEDDSEAYDAECSDDEYYSRQVPEISTRPCSSMESRTKSSTTRASNDMHDDEPQNSNELLDKETQTPPRFHRGARDRAGYVHSVLNPVENTAQWKNLKAKRTPLLNKQKENLEMDLGFEKSFLKSKSILEGPMSNYEVAVDASLSTWLDSSHKTPLMKTKPADLEPITSGGTISSHGSNSVRVQEERPILGALTMEELKQFAASSSPRRSPSRSPNEKPLLGTVGIHWDDRDDRTPIEDSTSASSFKGIPNTISKYREDKSVHWHSTPFETRLERALNRGAADYHT